MTVKIAGTPAPGFLDVDHLYSGDTNVENYITIKFFDADKAPVASMATAAGPFLAAIFNRAKQDGKLTVWDEVEPPVAEPPRRAINGLTDEQYAVELLALALKGLDYHIDRPSVKEQISAFLQYLDAKELATA